MSQLSDKRTEKRSVGQTVRQQSLSYVCTHWVQIPKKYLIYGSGSEKKNSFNTEIAKKRENYYYYNFILFFKQLPYYVYVFISNHILSLNKNLLKLVIIDLIMLNKNNTSIAKHNTIIFFLSQNILPTYLHTTNKHDKTPENF